MKPGDSGHAHLVAEGSAESPGVLVPDVGRIRGAPWYHGDEVVGDLAFVAHREEQAVTKQGPTQVASNLTALIFRVLRLEAAASNEAPVLLEAEERPVQRVPAFMRHRAHHPRAAMRVLGVIRIEIDAVLAHCLLWDE